MNETILAAILQGLCASPEVSQRSPKSIAVKAVQILEAVEDIKKNGLPAKEI